MHKMIHGNVKSNDSKEREREGEGDFVVQRLNKGIYQITFKVPFPTVPTVLATQNWDNFKSAGGDTRDNAVVIGVHQDNVKIKTGDCHGNPADRNFSFLAICEIPT